MSVGVATPEQAAAFVRARAGDGPWVGLVLGSGLGAFASTIRAAVRMSYADIPGFPLPAVEGHAGILVAGEIEGVRCLVLQGRPHLYEGHDPDAVAFPIRMLSALGLRALIVTNAAGGVNPRLRPGSLMLIEDHINLLWKNPLTGAVRPGESRFPDMSAPYDARLRAIAQQAAFALDLRLEHGIYCALSGPSYETPAEVRMLARLGADAVGMSTVPEVIVARAAGVAVLGLSLISNPAAGLGSAPLSHDEVMAEGAAAADRLAELLRAIVRALGPAEA